MSEYNKPYKPDEDFVVCGHEISMIKANETFAGMGIRDENRYWEYGRVIHFFRKYIQQPHQVFEVGGDGTPLAALIVTTSGHKVVTSDLNPGGEGSISMQRASMGISPEALSWVTCSGERVPFPDEYFDSVISISVIEHIPDEWPVLREMLRVLKPNGFIVLSFDFFITERAPGPFQLRFYTPQSLGAMVDRFAEYGVVPIETCDWSYAGNHITHQGHTYNGAMLICQKGSS